MKIFLVILLLLPLSVYAETISKEDIAATVAHRNQLIAQLQTEHDAALASQADTTKQLLAEQQAHTQTSQALSANEEIVKDLNGQITTLDNDISSLKWEVIKSRWEFAFVGIAMGIVFAIASFFAVKAGLLGSEWAAKLGGIALKSGI